MYKLASLVSALGLYAGLAQGQVAIPAVSGAPGGGDSGCGGCYVVADVAGIAFGTETIDAVATNINFVSAGRNGSMFTTTSIVFNQGQFTAGPSGVAAAAAPAPTGAGNIAYNTDGTTFVLSGVTLTSPTAYNVFTAYSVTSRVFTNGACSLVAGSASRLPTAFSVPIPANVNLQSFMIQAEQSFINNIGLPTCSPGGENYAATTQIPVNVMTTAITTTASPSRIQPSPVSVATRTTAATITGPTSSFVPFAPIANATRSAFIPGGTGTVILSSALSRSAISNSIAYAGASQLSAVGSFFAGAVALVAGLVA